MDRHSARLKVALPEGCLAISVGTQNLETPVSGWFIPPAGTKIQNELCFVKRKKLLRKNNARIDMCGSRN